MSNSFEQNKQESVFLLSRASLPEREIDFTQAHQLAWLASIFRSEMYHNGTQVVIKPELVDEFDAAVKRLFE
jgi:hypothetical protein